jgi:putative aldouronate transport system substrate-binding protein
LRPGQQLHHEDAYITSLQGKGVMAVSISARTRYREAAIRWLDYGYSPSGIVLMNWGVEGINWNYVNGVRTYNDRMLNNPRFGTEEASYIYKMHFAPKFTLLDTEVHANLLRSPESLAIRFVWADDPNVDSAFVLPPFHVNEREQAVRTRIMHQLFTYTDEMILKFITGAEPLARWDAYVATVNQLGLPELLRSEQEAYDRYLARTRR